MLSRLSAAEYDRIQPHLQTVPLTFGQTIYCPKSKIEHVYFPESGAVSILTDNHKPIEVGLVGAEGFTGLPLFLGVSRSPNELIVQADGTAQRISASAALAEFKRREDFHDAILLFAHDLFQQVSRITSCNRYHDVEPRLARWLLMMHDRADNGRLQLTQEFLSGMLGVRSQAVSRAAMALQDSHAIKYRRGFVTILDRETLEAKACPCYQLMKLDANGQRNDPLRPGGRYSSLRTDKET